ncbi:MAG: hypothetical protein JKX82_00170 [Oleispira sp.]|nr:hypothetical protein [Oleispira sp.]
MKPRQKLWSTFFLFAPVIYIGLKFGFWNGILALGINFILGMMIGWISVFSVPERYMGKLAYLKGPIIAGIIIFGFKYFLG